MSKDEMLFEYRKNERNTVRRHLRQSREKERKLLIVPGKKQELSELRKAIHTLEEWLENISVRDEDSFCGQ